jgi:hypothetical protein
MADEDDAPRWLLEPPAANEVHFSFSTGAEVELSDEARRALETLVAELSGNEVEGFAMNFGIWDCDELQSCPPQHCTLMNCQPLDSYPCAAKSHCKIVLD